MPAVFDLFYSVGIWIADTRASNYTSPYKEVTLKCEQTFVALEQSEYLEGHQE